MAKQLDITKKEAFEATMISVLNAGALNLAMGIGYARGLFDAMEAIGYPASAAVIAEQSGTDLRYVREWLGIMVTGRVVELSSMEDQTPVYFFPPEHAAVLTRRSGSSNLGVYTQEIPMLTRCAMEQVMDGFITGRGIPFSCYPQFQDFMAELSNAKHRQVLVDRFLPGVDNGNLIARLEKGIRVCDLGCGEGVALNLMAERFPKSRFTGIDNHRQALDAARSQALNMGLSNTDYRLEDAAVVKDRPEFAGCFDYVCAFDAIHDQTRPLEALESVRHMLTDTGIFSMVDIDAASDHAGNLEHPMGPFLYTVSLMHCMPVGLQDNGAGLGMMWGRSRAVALLRQAGFGTVDVLEMAHDPFNVHYQCRI